ncbi:MAG: hypothetical protein E6G02_09425 [Actinobacteria bacterium]|nr:MAG: hypothetical protein E6G02_09425 [Actinomycetota bacterium]
MLTRSAAVIVAVVVFSAGAAEAAISTPGNGFEVLCGDQAHRFLPFAVTTLKEGAIEIESPLVLLDFGQAGFYREQATTLSELNGDAAEVVIDRDGSIKVISSR